MDKLETYIGELLEEIDGHLSTLNVPLGERRLRAGIIIVRNFIAAVSGDDDKDDFAEKPWFAIIYHHIDQWYRARYGSLLNQNRSGFSRGVVLIRGLPVELMVPLTRSCAEVSGETAWLHFPINVDASEDPLSWLINAPPLDKLNEKEVLAVHEAVTDVASSLRSIRQFSTGVEPSDEIIEALLEGILPEVEGAASHLLRNDQNSVGPALWSLQMAVERSLKAYCQQKARSYKTTHDLFVLHRDAVPHGLDLTRSSLESLPRDAVDSRYGLGKPRSIGDAVDCYNSALTIVASIAKALSRKITIAGGRVLYKKPPWLTLPDTSSDRIATSRRA